MVLGYQIQLFGDYADNTGLGIDFQMVAPGVLSGHDALAGACPHQPVVLLFKETKMVWVFSQ